MLLTIGLGLAFSGAALAASAQRLSARKTKGS
jgi:hypothetical protein